MNSQTQASATSSAWWNRIAIGCIVGVMLIMCWAGLLVAGDDISTLQPTVRLLAEGSADQDDMCFWVHASQPANSIVITSDKKASKLFVYDLEGHTLQTIDAPKPGNIDLRQGVKLDGRLVDIVVVNQRTDGFKLLAFQVNRETRQLERLDKTPLTTGQNYGGCLYHSRHSGRLFFICTAETGLVEQHELLGDGQGGVTNRKVRTWQIGKCEGAVADDETGQLYIAEERTGVWKLAAEPDAPATPTLIIPVAAGEKTLRGDVEGLAIVKGLNKTGYLLISDQGSHRYMVYQRAAPHAFVGAFGIAGAEQTDGIEVLAADLGAKFPGGLFACHTDIAPRAMLLTPWKSIAEKLNLKAASASK